MKNFIELHTEKDPGTLGGKRSITGQEARGQITLRIHEIFGGVHQRTSSAYTDYTSGVVAYLDPSRRDGEAVMQAIRAIMPDWTRVDVSVQPERNIIVWTCYANNQITCS